MSVCVCVSVCTRGCYKRECMVCKDVALRLVGYVFGLNGDSHRGS
jgi:hypothetical protein